MQHYEHVAFEQIPAAAFISESSQVGLQRILDKDGIIFHLKRMKTQQALMALRIRKVLSGFNYTLSSIKIS